MLNGAVFGIVDENDSYVLIRDLGPWSQHKTITNDAEMVVEKMIATLGGRRLRYIDSEGVESEIVIKNGKFAGFSP